MQQRVSITGLNLSKPMKQNYNYHAAPFNANTGANGQFLAF